jgi:outer membrane protein insertion porin family
MTFSRPGRLRVLAVCLFVGGVFSLSLSAQPQPPQPPPPAKPQPEQKKNNPFEAIPESQEPQPPKPQPPKLETPKPEEAKPATAPEDIVESIVIRGARRIPQDTLKALITTKPGDKYDPEQLNRDFMILWNSGHFDDIRMEREPGQHGWIITFVVVERRIVRSIKYDGMKSITVSEILDRFKERKVGLSVESQYDPNKVQRAKVVLQEYLAERGRQFATVDPQIHQVPPSSLEIVFKVNEGPKVKVGSITFDGNDHMSDRKLIAAMKNLHPYGIPHSLFFEDLFAKTYDSSKLEEDRERIQQFYQDHGYFTAHTTDAKVDIVTTITGGSFRIPLIHQQSLGKAANIHISVEEGRLYHLNNINFVGVKLFRTPDSLMKPVFGMGQGDVFSTAKLRKGITDLQKLYGQFGYIDAIAEPSFEPVPNTDKLDLTLTLDEGKQFFVRRIDFSGNTTTRDKVIRRQLLVDEGDVFNTHLWELSILRLNQLGYFEPLKEEEAADIKRDTKTDTVDITLKVKERGKNSVQLNGGVSAIAGSFIGFSYSTNNFLGETLSLSTQLGTIQRSAQFGFTEPYLFDIPLQVGFTIFDSRFNYDQAKQVSILAGQNLVPLFNQLGAQNLLNYISDSYGATVFGSYPLKRSFARLGLSYGYTIQHVKALTTAAQDYFNYLDFLRINGPNPLDRIRTSTLTPSYTYNTVDHPITPTRGKAVSLSVSYSGGPIGGNVNQIEPVVDLKYFRKSPINAKHIIGLHAAGRWLTGYGGKVASPLNRFYMGGENDIRGFDIWGITPIAFVPTSASIQVLNNDGSPLMQKGLNSNGQVTQIPVYTTIPAYQMVTPGGDLSTWGNAEYRIPIFGPVTLALFIDAGANKLAQTSQLKLNPSDVSTLQGEFPEASFPNRAIVAPGTQSWRMSTGLEIQVLMPVVNAPFRVYWAYNPLRVDEVIQPPIVADRTYFPNAATFANAVAQFGQPVPFFEQANTFRFTIGRTF